MAENRNPDDGCWSRQRLWQEAVLIEMLGEGSIRVRMFAALGLNRLIDGYNNPQLDPCEMVAGGEREHCLSFRFHPKLTCML
ncbi:hypothetical protein L1887_39268 [Cichorium endivia]|nr:hypothetical protein L1887_39268 [Cichorium endivia]